MPQVRYSLLPRMSDQKQQAYRTRELRLPAKPPPVQGQLWTLWPECKTCGNAGYIPAGFERRFKRCPCRAKAPLRFPSQIERDEAQRAQWRASQPPPEQRAFLSLEWQQWKLDFDKLLESKDMNETIRLPGWSAQETIYF